MNDLALPGSGLHLQDARLINDPGAIVCTGVLPNGDQHAGLLMPVGEADDSATNGPAAAQSTVARSVPSVPQQPSQSPQKDRYRIPGLRPSSR